MQIQIENWKTLVDQFGLDDTYMGLKSARQISIEMKKQIEKMAKPPIHFDIRCNTDSEAICTFNLIKSVPGLAFYEYTGTAN